MHEKTYLQYFALRYLLTYLQYAIITYYRITYLHITLLKDLQYTVVTYLHKKEILATNYALTGEIGFPLLLKFPFTIQRDSNIFLDFILH